MSWLELATSIVEGVGQFFTSFSGIIGGSLNSDTIEGILALGAIAIVISILEGKTKIRLPKIPKLRRDDKDEDDYEYIKVRRQK